MVFHEGCGIAKGGGGEEKQEIINPTIESSGDDSRKAEKNPIPGKKNTASNEAGVGNESKPKFRRSMRIGSGARPY